MSTTPNGWNILCKNPPVLTRQYSFGGGRATACAVGLGGGRLLIYSPPCKIEQNVIDDLKDYGAVVALVANNGAHHMGLPLWSEAFPEAKAYAGPAAAKRIKKKCKKAPEILGLGALSELVGDAIEVLEVPGTRMGDVVLRLQTENGTAWCVGDFVGNAPLPKNPIFRLVFKWTKSGPGFSVNRLFHKLFVKDTRAVKEFFLRELDRKPMHIFVPAHGEPIVRDGLADELKTMFENAL